MPTYQYKARTQDGKSIQGLMGADSEQAVASKLEAMGHLPIDIRLLKEKTEGPSFFDRFKRVSFEDLNLFTRQLATLQRAGIPLLTSLGSLKEQAANYQLKKTIEVIIRDVEGGSSLSGALERHPVVFSALYVNMVRSGEMSGQLPEVLNRLATLGEHDEKIRRQISAAMRYPAIVVAAMIIGFMVLIVFVMPRFINIYGQYNTALPMPTQIMIGLSVITKEFWWLLLGLLAIAIFLFKSYKESTSGRKVTDEIKLKIPVFGPLMHKLLMSRFCRATGTLLKSGVPILQILELNKAGAGNVKLGETIDQVIQSVKEGKGMAEPMKQSGCFPVIVTQMVSVGEESGRLDELMIYASDYYDLLIDHTIKNLVSLIEPLLIFVLGIAVLFMALGIFMPMWNLMQLFKR